MCGNSLYLIDTRDNQGFSACISAVYNVVFDILQLVFSFVKRPLHPVLVFVQIGCFLQTFVHQ